MKKQITKISSYLESIGEKKVATELKFRAFFEPAEITRFINTSCVLKANNWEKIMKIINEESQPWGDQ